MERLPSPIIVRIILEQGSPPSTQYLFGLACLCKWLHRVIMESSHGDRLWQACWEASCNNKRRLELVRQAMALHQRRGFQTSWYEGVKRLLKPWRIMEDYLTAGVKSGGNYRFYAERLYDIEERAHQLLQLVPPSLQRDTTNRVFVMSVEEDVKRHRLQVTFGMRFTKSFQVEVVLETKLDPLTFPENWPKNVAEITLCDHRGDRALLLRHSYLNKTDCTCGCGPFFKLTHSPFHLEPEIRVDTAKHVSTFMYLALLDHLPVGDVCILLMRCISVATLFGVQDDPTRKEHADYLCKTYTKPQYCGF
jgi:hypothetical protein